MPSTHNKGEEKRYPLAKSDGDGIPLHGWRFLICHYTSNVDFSSLQFCIIEKIYEMIYFSFLFFEMVKS